MTEKKKVGVVLFQLGGPDSASAVEPFLYNLFCDPDIIDFFGAWFARRPLARYIARSRAGVVREHYDAIGVEISPNLRGVLVIDVIPGNGRSRCHQSDPESYRSWPWGNP